MEKDIKLILRYMKAFFKSRKLILISVGIAFIVGILSVIFSRPIYKAETSFISQSGSEPSSSSGLKNIAALIGVNVGAKQEFKDIPVYLYPKLTGSVVYNKKLLDSRVKISGRDSLITIREYIIENNKPTVVQTIKGYTIGLPGKIIKFFRKKPPSSSTNKIDDLEYLSSEDVKLMKYLSENVVLSIDSDDGSLKITASSNTPVVAAQMAENSKSILQQLIIDYRIGKFQDNYAFIESQYQLKKKEYEEARSALAYYVDRNSFNTTQTSLIRKRDLENKSSLAYSLYSELENQRINAQISLKEETPIFTTINPSVVPIDTSNPSAIVTLIKYLIFGLFVAVLIFVFRIGLFYTKSLWREAEYHKS